MQCVTSDDRVAKLVDFVNKNIPRAYDYPVQDVTVEPVSEGNKEYIQWIKNQKTTFKLDKESAETQDE